MFSLAKIDKDFDSSIKLISQSNNTEQAIRSVTEDMGKALKDRYPIDKACIAYFIDSKKDENAFKQDLAIRALGISGIQDPQVINYLLKALKSKTQIESFLGKYTPRGKIGAIAVGATTMTVGGAVGFMSGGFFGGTIGLFFGKTIAQQSLSYISSNSTRISAAIALGYLNSTSPKILAALNDRLNDPDEDEEVIKAVHNAINYLSPPTIGAGIG